MAETKTPYIRVKGINKTDCKVSISYEVSTDLRKYFKTDVFWYSWAPGALPSATRLPDSIAVLPFIANVLPLAWLTDSIIHVDRLDQAFYESVPEFKVGYIKMYPDLSFRGEVIADIVEKNEYPNNGSVVMFSGGIDALTTTLRHYDEKPQTLTLHGSEDFPLDDEKGWALQKKNLTENLGKLHLGNTVIETNFCAFLDSWSDDFTALIGKGSYWHEMQHGIGILSHAAPFCYFNSIGTCYIASSFTKEFIGVNTCASDPTIDNHVRFGSTRVIHDGYELNRQQKVGYIVRKLDELGLKLNVHVCFLQYQNDNCCQCEKCIRTILAIIAEGKKPKNLGFEKPLDFDYIFGFLRNTYNFTPADILVYKATQERMLENSDNVLYPEAVEGMKKLNIERINYTPRKIFRRFLKKIGLYDIIVSARKKTGI